MRRRTPGQVYNISTGRAVRVGALLDLCDHRAPPASLTGTLRLQVSFAKEDGGMAQCPSGNTEVAAGVRWCGICHAEGSRLD